jgi:hypothetical protein
VSTTNIVQNLDAWRGQGIEALGAKSGISFQPRPGGEMFTVPHPLVLDDDQNEDLDRASGTVPIATVLIGGPSTYARFKSVGGRAGDVMMAWRMMQQGVSLDPTSAAFTASSAAAPISSNPTSSTVTPASAVPSTNGGAPLAAAPAS